MGLDPDDSDYEAGVICPDCVNEIFGGQTPKFITANVSGVVACPGWTRIIPNGSFLCEQTPGTPCEWVGQVGALLIIFNVRFAGGATVTATDGPAKVVFLEFSMGACRTIYPSNLRCDGPMPSESCAGGIMQLSWGPDIPCGGP